MEVDTTPMETDEANDSLRWKEDNVAEQGASAAPQHIHKS